MPLLDPNPEIFPVLLVSDRPMSENKTGNWRNVRPKIDIEKCTNCLLCWKFCPEACVRIGVKFPEIDLNYCKGCAICVEVCPQKCVHAKDEASS